MTSQNPLVEELRKLTGDEKMEAAEGVFYLEMCEGNVETAAALYREELQNSASSKLTSSASALRNDESSALLVTRQQPETSGQHHPLRTSSDGAATTGLRRRATVDRSSDLITSSLNTLSFAEPRVGLVSNPRNRSMKFAFYRDQLSLTRSDDFQEVAATGSRLSIEAAAIASTMDASINSSEPGSGLITTPRNNHLHESVSSYGSNLESPFARDASLPENDDSDLDAAIAASLNECVANELQLHEALETEGKKAPGHASPNTASSSNEEQYSKTKRAAAAAAAAATAPGVVRAILHPDTVEEPTHQNSGSHQNFDRTENPPAATAQCSTNLDEKSAKLRKTKPPSRPGAISSVVSPDGEITSSSSEVPGGNTSMDASSRSLSSPSPPPIGSLNDKNSSKVRRAPATVPGVFSVFDEHAVTEPRSIRDMTPLPNIVKRQSQTTASERKNSTEDSNSEDPDTKFKADGKPRMSPAFAPGAISIGPEDPVTSPDSDASSQKEPLSEKTKLKLPVQLLPALTPGVVRVPGGDHHAKERQTTKKEKTKISSSNSTSITSQARGSQPGTMMQASNKDNPEMSEKNKSRGRDSGNKPGSVHVTSKEAAKMSKYGKHKSNKEKGGKPGAVHVHSKEATKVSKTIKYGLPSSMQQTKVQRGALNGEPTETANENRDVPLVQHVDHADEDPTMVKGEREITIPGTAPSVSGTVDSGSPATATTTTERPLRSTRPKPLPVQPPLPGIRRADRHKRRGLFGTIFKKKEKNVTS